MEREWLREMSLEERLCMLVEKIFLISFSGINISIIWLKEERWAERVMQDLMNDRDVSPDDRTFCAIIKGYSCLFHGDRNWRAERMYFWLCKMRDLRIQPTHHHVKCFTKMNLYFPAVDEPFWTTDFGMPFDPHRHGRRRH